MTTRMRSSCSASLEETIILKAQSSKYVCLENVIVVARINLKLLFTLHQFRYENNFTMGGGIDEEGKVEPATKFAVKKKEQEPVAAVETKPAAISTPNAVASTIVNTSGTEDEV